MPIKNIEINVLRKVQVQDTPFKAIIYVLKDQNNIIIENPATGKSILTGSHSIGEYLKLKNLTVPWTRTFNHSYVSFKDNGIHHFVPLFPEPHRFVNLSFVVDGNLAPSFKTRQIGNRLFVDNSIPANNPDLDGSLLRRTYNYLFQNVRNFEVENFKLEMIDGRDGIHERYAEVQDPLPAALLDDDVRRIMRNRVLLQVPYITCRVPLFQLFSLVEPNYRTTAASRLSRPILNERPNRFGYNQKHIFMKIGNKFYKFPYGNTGSSDVMCMGDGRNTHNLRKEPDSIETTIYSHIITSDANGDYAANLRYDNGELTTFDITHIREKVNNDDFSISFMDAIFYLSQCNSIEDINLNIFMLSINVPEPILNMEGCSEENSLVSRISDEEPADEEPADEERVDIQPRLAEGHAPERAETRDLDINDVVEELIEPRDATTTMEFVQRDAIGLNENPPLRYRDTEEERVRIDSISAPIIPPEEWHEFTIPINSTIVINGVEQRIVADSTAAENPNAESSAAGVPLSGVLLGEANLVSTHEHDLGSSNTRRSLPSVEELAESLGDRLIGPRELRQVEEIVRSEEAPPDPPEFIENLQTLNEVVNEN